MKKYDELTGLYDYKTFCTEAKKLICEKGEKEPYALIHMKFVNLVEYGITHGKEAANAIMVNSANFFQVKESKLVKNNSVIGFWKKVGFFFLLPKSYLGKHEIYEFFHEYKTTLAAGAELSVAYSVYYITDTSMSFQKMLYTLLESRPHIRNLSIKKVSAKDQKNVFSETQILNLMEEAFEKKYFHPYYQPIHSSLTASIVAAEVLCRYIDADGNMISPSVFIPILERNNLITKLDMYIWEQACKHLASRQEAGENIVPLTINISRKDFFECDLPAFLILLVEKYYLSPSLICIEITETVYIGNFEKIIADINVLQKYGFQIYMDDFGSGYSSISLLFELSIDVIKIDRALIMHIEDSKKAKCILGSIIRMAQWLGMRTVAEGVETLEQYYFLRSLGCSNIQGFYFSIPMPEAEFGEILLENPRLNFEDVQLPILDIENISVSLAENPILDTMLNMAGALSVLELDLKTYSFYVVKANDQFYQTYNDLFTRDGITEYTIGMFYEPDQKIIRNAIDNAMKKGSIVSAKYRVPIDRNGKMRWISLKLKYLGKQQDRPYFIAYTYPFANALKSV